MVYCRILWYIAVYCCVTACYSSALSPCLSTLVSPRVADLANIDPMYQRRPQAPQQVVQKWRTVRASSHIVALYCTAMYHNTLRYSLEFFLLLFQGRLRDAEQSEERE